MGVFQRTARAARTKHPTRRLLRTVPLADVTRESARQTYGRQRAIMMRRGPSICSDLAAGVGHADDVHRLDCGDLGCRDLLRRGALVLATRPRYHHHTITVSPSHTHTRCVHTRTMRTPRMMPAADLEVPQLPAAWCWCCWTQR